MRSPRSAGGPSEWRREHIVRRDNSFLGFDPTATFGTRHLANSQLWPLLCEGGAEVPRETTTHRRPNCPATVWEYQKAPWERRTTAHTSRLISESIASAA